MFLLIELDWDFSIGIDWFKYSKGFRLGFIAIHICTTKFSKFIEACIEVSKEEKQNL